MNPGLHTGRHLGGLRRFAVAITVLNVLGHLVFGFEQSYAQPLVSLLAAYGTELLLEVVDARTTDRRPRFTGGLGNFVDFLLSAHITGLAVAMLLYANDRLWVIALASSLAIGSKAIFRVRVGDSSRHFLNPSNFGIAVTLLVFPWVGIAPPYQFTEELNGIGDWVLPGVIVITGSLLNTLFTGRVTLLATWLAVFALQALARSWVFDTPTLPALTPATGVAFVLYTFYMVTDPATTPARRRGQIAFGAAVGLTYGALMMAHVVFGLFFALAIVCVLRGVLLALWQMQEVQTGASSVEPPSEAIVLAKIEKM